MTSPHRAAADGLALILTRFGRSLDLRRLESE